MMLIQFVGELGYCAHAGEEPVRARDALEGLSQVYSGCQLDSSRAFGRPILPAGMRQDMRRGRHLRWAADIQEDGLLPLISLVGQYGSSFGYSLLQRVYPDWSSDPLARSDSTTLRMLDDLLSAEDGPALDRRWPTPSHRLYFHVLNDLVQSYAQAVNRQLGLLDAQGLTLLGGALRGARSAFSSWLLERGYPLGQLLLRERDDLFHRVLDLLPGPLMYQVLCDIAESRLPEVEPSVRGGLETGLRCVRGWLAGNIDDEALSQISLGLPRVSEQPEAARQLASCVASLMAPPEQDLVSAAQAQGAFEDPELFEALLAIRLEQAETGRTIGGAG